MAGNQAFFPTVGYQYGGFARLPDELESRSQDKEMRKLEVESARRRDTLEKQTVDDAGAKRMLDAWDQFVMEAGTARTKPKKEALISRYRDKWSKNGWGDFGVRDVEPKNEHFVKIVEDDEEDGVAEYYANISGKDLRERMSNYAVSDDEMLNYIKSRSAMDVGADDTKVKEAHAMAAKRHERAMKEVDDIRKTLDDTLKEYGELGEPASRASLKGQAARLREEAEGLRNAWMFKDPAGAAEREARAAAMDEVIKSIDALDKAIADKRSKAEDAYKRMEEIEAGLGVAMGGLGSRAPGGNAAFSVEEEQGEGLEIEPQPAPQGDMQTRPGVRPLEVRAMDSRPVMAVDDADIGELSRAVKMDKKDFAERWKRLSEEARQTLRNEILRRGR